jgi:ribosomal protein L7/L12
MQRIAREALVRSASVDEMFGLLREESSSPMETIKAVRSVSGISLRLAKDLLAGSEVWSDIHPHVAETREVVWRDLENDGTLTRQGGRWHLKIDL